MKIKVRILMVLLCLFMFPLRVFALEEAVGVTSNNQSNDNVAVVEDTANDVVDATDNEELPVEGSNENTNTEEDNNPVEDVTQVKIDKIVLENVNFSLKVGKLPEFSGSALELDSSKYSLYYEAVYAENEGIRTYYYSLDSKNEEYAQSGTVLSEINDRDLYHYEFAIQTKADAELVNSQNEFGASGIKIVINGTEYFAYAHLDKYLENGDVIYLVRPNFFIMGEYEDKEYLDSVSFNDINYNITVGKKPVYSGKVDPSLEGKIKLSCENWTYYVYLEEQETGYVEYNYSDPSFLEPGDNVFETFEMDKNYSYSLLFHVEDGYALKTYYDSVIPYHIVYVNGEEYYIPFYNAFEINGSEYYYVDTRSEVSPVAESYNVIEGADTTLSSTDDGVLKLRVDGEYDLFEKVYVDNQLIHDGYTVESGSTIITFTNAFLKSLSVGTHEVIVTYSDGKSAYTTLTIQEGTSSSEDEGSITEPVTPAQPVIPVTPTISNNVSNSNSYTNAVVNSLAEKDEDEDLEIAEDDKEYDEDEEEKEDKKKSDKSEEENQTKNNSIFYIILVIILLIIIAISFVIFRKKQ